MTKSPPPTPGAADEQHVDDLAAAARKQAQHRAGLAAVKRLWKEAAKVLAPPKD